MITNKDIRIAVNRQLAKTGVEITSKDVSEGYSKPSFFVDFDNVNRSGNESQVEKSMTVRIYYFPSDRHEYSIEVLDMQENLENLFDLKLKVKDRFLNTMEFNSFVNDGVLQCSFDLEFFDGRKTDYGNVIIVVDDEGYPILDENGNLIDEPIEIDDGEFGTPVEVPADENGNPILDKDGKPISIRKMKDLYINKE